MPDITMCKSSACPRAKECYRFMAIPSEYRQAYAGFLPKKGECDEFVEIEGRRIKDDATSITE